ncbi:helix-hairpin-helix domain-containing protein [Microbacterium sp. UFMG61]|uniref:helix-hairpin-helix domain-containing protein n=1 Tax=Microbacterium sp. UFMG61 TaxID=2745935 RepID=UPI0018908D28|nr:ComEA family DNA-binding protein [Microbacterium sp. UFMG61]
MSDTLPPPPRPRRLQLSLGAAVIVGLVVLSGAVGLGLLKGQAAPTESVSIDADADESGASGELYVHVLGAVEHPGLYVLDLDSRMVDAVAAAGGTTDSADLAGINLARTLEDGEQIIVPVAGVVDGGGDAVVAQPADDRVDLNAADQAALETLPRIGPALAERIIAWREENGGFQSVDDLLAVPGIGEKLLAGIREAVRV